LPRRQTNGLLGTAAGEGKPAIQSGGTLLAATARSDSDGRCRPLDHVTEADILITDEAGEADAVRSALMVVASTILCLFGIHDSHLLLFVFSMDWYAAQASNKGGTIVVLRCVDT